MRMFRRINDIISANMNEMIDRFEDPEVMLRQAIREMDTMIEQATGAAARAIAGERLLAKDLADQELKTERWRARAEEAVRRGDDKLALSMIARAHEHEALASALAPQRSSAGDAAEALRRQVTAMRAKQAEARRKLASLAARRHLAEASGAILGMGTTSSQGANGFSRFERMVPQVEQAEAEAMALVELHEGSGSSLEDEAASREQARLVEAELAAIKERLRASRGPNG
jgi:phage shock protein A